MTYGNAATAVESLGRPFDGQADISARLERLPITSGLLDAQHHRRRDLLRRLHRHRHRLRDAGPGARVGARSAADRHDPVDGLSRPALRRRASSAGLPSASGGCRVLLFTILLFVSMDIACLFAGGAASMMLFRFVQGIGTGGEVPVASAYINEYIGSKGRGRFFLLYEVMFLLGLVGAGLIARALVPVYGWKAMFIVGLVPALVLLPLRFFMKESPRWLASKGRYEEADRIVSALERSAIGAGHKLAEPPSPSRRRRSQSRSNWRELFQGIYRRRTLTIWAMWFCSYLVANGMITWLPTLYRQTFNLPLETSILYGLLTSVAGVIASIACALLIDRVGRKRWYVAAFLLAPVPLVGARLARRGRRRPRCSSSRGLPTPSCRRSPSRSTSTRRRSIRRGCARSARASAAHGSGSALLPARSSSAGSWPPPASSTSSRRSRSFSSSAPW